MITGTVKELALYTFPDGLLTIADNFLATTVTIKYSNMALKKMPSNKNP